METPFTLTRAAVRELDRRAIDGFGVPGVVLMENAGRGCADLLARLNPERRPTVILCGPGNNGGDGFVIARHLDNRGWPVSVHVLARHNRTAGDADVNFDILYTSGIHFTQYRPDYFDQPHRDLFVRQAFAEPGWVVDALFGTGLSRPLAAPFDWLVGAVNDSGFPVLAIDIPSGLDCDTGEPLGPTVRATHTATFVAPKRGFLNPAAADWTGQVHVIDIGAPRVLIDEYRTRPG
ncbi:NAD(P)H-hydrate epimerase [Gemmata sp.]|uniref:NAD(P)H-hydrate epimerase n=1 Tax=Gemmata sp. TaxID=1914242 RepID=UPI003F70A171